MLFPLPLATRCAGTRCPSDGALRLSAKFRELQLDAEDAAGAATVARTGSGASSACAGQTYEAALHGRGFAGGRPSDI